MKIQAYCSHCKKTSFIDVDEDELSAHINTENLVPLPRGGSELLQRNLSHGDHILLIEIDRNGVIRKQKVVYLISSVIENIITQAVENTIKVNNKVQNKIKTLLYISDSSAFVDFFKSVLSIIMLNVNDAKKS